MRARATPRGSSPGIRVLGSEPALPEPPNGRVRRGLPDRPCGPHYALRPQSIHEPCPFRERRVHPCSQFRAAFQATSMRILCALSVLRYSPLNLLLQTTMPKVAHPIDIKVWAPESERSNSAKVFKNNELSISMEQELFAAVQWFATEGLGAVVNYCGIYTVGVGPIWTAEARNRAEARRLPRRKNPPYA